MSDSSVKHLGLAAARRIVVIVVGASLTVVGLVLVFTPGPAFVVLTLALGVFAIEFAWARRWLRKARESTRALLPEAVRGTGDSQAGESREGPRPADGDEKPGKPTG